jgi:long-chain-fatty-acid--CoA ligase ACSBG
MHVYFAQPDVLQGTLIQTLQEVRPTVFFAVPRIWEKIYDKMMEMSKSNSGIKNKIGTFFFI